MTDTPPAPTRRVFLIGAAAAFALANLDRAEAAPASRLIDERWNAFGAGGDPEYGRWAAFLDRWVKLGEDGIARVDYGGALAAGGRDEVLAFLDEMQAIDPTTLSRPAAMGYWLNLYNAATVDLVLGDYPVDTIKKIKGGLFNTGPWKEMVLAVNDAPLSLDDVEHGILRPIWNDPRIHYAVNCASIGCPNLAPAPWSSTDLEARLDQAARAYVNHPRGARVRGGELRVSKIYDWFKEDFGDTDAGVIKHLRRYAEPELAAALAGVDRIDDTVYDWDLNDV